jgi:Uma2 family endonuclease
MAVEVVAATRRLFTRAEYYRMAEAGILGEDDRVELIKGEIIQMSPIGRLHFAFVINLNKLLVVRLGDRAHVSVQGPVALSDDTEPQPDIAVLRLRATPYRQREAWAEDALLLIEVADSSLRYDRTTKLRLYAEAGIPEYWIVDCTTKTVEVYRNPGPEGYRDVASAAGSTPLTLQAFPEVALTPAEIFA